MAKFADYYIKYKHEFAPYDWEDRQKHLATLFQEDKDIVFGEGEASEEQAKKGIPYDKVYNHRVYHLESNPNIIVMQFANSIDIPIEIKYENSIAKTEPSCFVIIDNREGMRTIAIQNRRKAFSAPKRVAEILTREINKVLFCEYCYDLEILPKYYPEDLVEAWEKLQDNTRKMFFGNPNMSKEELLKRVEELKQKKKGYFDDSLIPALLQVAFAAKEDKHNLRMEVSCEEKLTCASLNETSTYMKNMLTLASASHTPVELVTKDGATYRCFVESDEENTDKIIHKQLDAQLLEMLFKGKKRNGEKVEHDDIIKGEAAIVEMLNGMKNTSVDD